MLMQSKPGPPWRDRNWRMPQSKKPSLGQGLGQGFKGLTTRQPCLPTPGLPGNCNGGTRLPWPYTACRVHASISGNGGQANGTSGQVDYLTTRPKSLEFQQVVEIPRRPIICLPCCKLEQGEAPEFGLLRHCSICADESKIALECNISNSINKLECANNARSG